MSLTSENDASPSSSTASVMPQGVPTAPRKRKLNPCDPLHDETVVDQLLDELRQTQNLLQQRDMENTALLRHNQQQAPPPPVPPAPSAPRCFPQRLFRCPLG
eukprot:GHVU01152234.1.p2 GENE.GHVU01152234.1~~GHVU01152234.1.p2  ORF type:complete len:102 (+),score=12.03 GHVU01152234.1:995-1300(+)